MKKKQKRYSLTVDQIKEIVYCARDCELTDDELANYIKAFLAGLKK